MHINISVCVCEREREIEKEREKISETEEMGMWWHMCRDARACVHESVWCVCVCVLV